jgi:CheY-like chemotaxis protein
MPETDGFGVLEAMRENESMRKIPVIVVMARL